MNILRKMSILMMTLSGLMLLLLGAAFGQTQADMNQVANKAEHRADVEMTARYNKLRTVLTPGQKGRLQEVQRAWLKFRDAEAAFLSLKVEGGSVYPMVYAGHLRELTQARSLQLKKAYVLYTRDGEM
jgi:uncharacterized protein YecT (DUF1311 family)